MAFSDIRDVVSFGPEHRTITMLDGTQLRTSGVGIRASDEISDDAAIAIAEVSEGRDGIKVKLVDRRAALMDLAKITGEVEDSRTDAIAAIGAMLATLRRSSLPIGIGNSPSTAVLEARIADAEVVTPDYDPDEGPDP